MERRGGPGDRGGCEGAVAAGVHLCLHPHAVCGAACVGRCLILGPDTRQQQRAEPGIQCRAVGRVWMEHGVVVAGVDVRVGMVDVVDSRVATWALGVQAVGPTVRQVRRRWEPALGEQVVGPKGPVWMVYGYGAGGEVWVEGWEAGARLGWIGTAPDRGALTLGPTVWNALKC